MNAPTYRIAQLRDFLAIPANRLAPCLASFHAFVDRVRPSPPTELEFSWTDARVHAVELTGFDALSEEFRDELEG